MRRRAIAAAFLLLMLGCQSPGGYERPIETSVTSLRAPNGGRLVGTVTASATALGWAGVPTLTGATAQLFEIDGRPVSSGATLGADGRFTLQSVSATRPRLFVNVAVGALRFRAVVPAPRDGRDYLVTINAAGTYLADKLRRSTLDQETDLGNLDVDLLGKAIAAIDHVMTDDERRRVLQQHNADLNAHDFDYFMERYPAVKRAVYRLSPGVLRGWAPPPSSRPVVTPSLAAPPTADPVPAPSETPDPDAVGR